MDPEKDNKSPPPKALSGSQGSPAGIGPEIEGSIESLVPKKRIRKNRAANKVLGGEEEGGPVKSANENPRSRKRTLGSARAAVFESEGATKPEETSDNEQGEEASSPAKKRRKPPKASTGQKGNWTTEEDNLILRSKKEGKSWQDITNLVRAAGSLETDRTMTAVRLRYQKVLKDRDIELTTEELGFLKQAETDVLTTEKYRYIAERYKQLSGSELSKGACQRMLALAKKGGSSVTKDEGESSKE